MKKRKMTQALIMWVIPTLFFLYEYVLRVSPSAMIRKLEAHYGIDEAAFGFVVSLFYYAYGPMQLPAGLIIDRYGPRKVVCLTLSLCVLGGLLFAWANHTAVAAFARFLIGFSGAFSFVSAVRIIRNWFSSDHFAFMTGLTIMLGTSGAILGQGPIAKASTLFGWDAALWGSALLGLPLALFAYFVLRDHPPGHSRGIPEKTEIGMKKNIFLVLQNPQTWCIALYAFFITTPTSGFGVLWGTAYLADLYTISNAEASSLLSLIFVGWVIGAPLSGWLSDWMRRRQSIMLFSAVGAFATMLAILYFPSSSLFLMGALLLLFGVFSGAVTISYTIACEINLPSSSGTASGLTNMLAMSGAIFVQPFIGWMLDKSGDYGLSFAVLPISLACAVAISFFIRENRCVQRT